jgi:hypothetical protein
VFDPSQFGSILNIDFTVDRRTIHATYGGSTQLRLLAEQDGRVFGTPFMISPWPSPTYSNWTTAPYTGIQIDQLQEFINPYGNNRFPTHPWPQFFSGPSLSSLESNSPIRFGFMTETGAQYGGQTIAMGFDNLHISITHAQASHTAVPEPQSIVLCCIGLASMLVVLRKKQMGRSNGLFTPSTAASGA